MNTANEFWALYNVPEVKVFKRSNPKKTDGIRPVSDNNYEAIASSVGKRALAGLTRPHSWGYRYLPVL